MSQGASTHEVQEARKHRVALFEPRADAPAALELAKQSFDLPVRLRRHPQIIHIVAGLVALAGAVHRQRRVPGQLVPAFQKDAAFGRIVGLAAGQAKNHAQMVTCRDHVDIRVPSAPQLADALRPACLSRPGAVRMQLGAGAIEAEALHIRSARLRIPQRHEQPVNHADVRPAAEPGVDRISFSEVTRQGARLAAVLHDIENGVDESEVRDPHFPALNRQSFTARSYFIIDRP